MTHESSLNEATLARQCLQHLGEDKSVLHRAAYVLQLVAYSSVGLGEVLQDYAHQAWTQLSEVIRASRNAGSNMLAQEDIEIIRNAPVVMKSVKTVLERTPIAMQNNKAETLGEKEKFSRADVVEVAHDFNASADVRRLLASEDAGHTLVAILAPQKTSDTLIVADATDEFPHAQARH